MFVESDGCRSSNCKDVRSRVVSVGCNVTTHPTAAFESMLDVLQAEPAAGRQPAGQAIRHKLPLSPPMRDPTEGAPELEGRYNAPRATQS